MEGISLDGSIVHKTLKHGIPTNDEVEGLGIKIAGKWRKLGRRLGITDESLDQIDQKQRDKGYRMLKQWKEEKGCEATYKVLSKALKHDFVKRRDLEAKFCYSDGPPTVHQLASPVQEERLSEEVPGASACTYVGGALGKDQEDSSEVRSELKRKMSDLDSQQVKHGTPSGDELEALGSLIAEDWKRLGRRLHIADETLEEIEKAFGDDLPEKGYQMLRKWKQQCAYASTYKMLCDALEHDFVKRRDLAVEFCYINEPPAVQQLASSVREKGVSEEVPGASADTYMYVGEASNKDQDDSKRVRYSLKRKLLDPNPERGRMSWITNCARAIKRNLKTQDHNEASEKVNSLISEMVDWAKGQFDTSKGTGLKQFSAYLSEGLQLISVEFEKGSIKVNAKCRTLAILECLWADYCSGHLNAVAEECLITEEVKEELDMKIIELKTTMLEEDYLACRLSLMEISRINISKDTLQAILIGFTVATFLLRTGHVLKAIEFWEECLILLNDEALQLEETYFNFLNSGICEAIFNSSCLIPDTPNAVKHGRKLLDIFRECGKTAEEEKLALTLANMCEQKFQYPEAREFYERAINVTKETGNREEQAFAYWKVGTMAYRLSDHFEAIEYLEKALAIAIEIGNRKGEASSYGILGNVFQSLGEYDKANEYHEKALPIVIDIGDRAGQGSCYGNLGSVFKSRAQYDKAMAYLEKALEIKIQLGEREGEASCLGNLGTVFQSLAEYDKANEYLEKALAISVQIGDRAGEAVEYGNLGTVFRSLGEYDKAKAYHEKALEIRKQIGEKAGEAADYGNLGTVFQSLGEYGKAKEYLEKALIIQIQIGDKIGEASSRRKLGNVFKSLAEYFEAEKYLKKALEIAIPIGAKAEEASSYENLGTVFQSRGEYNEAKVYLEQALEITAQIGAKAEEASCYRNLGTVFQSLGEYDKAKEYLQKALAITVQIGATAEEARCYERFGTVFQSVGEYDKAKVYLEKALAIARQIDDKTAEASCYEKLGTLFQSLGQYEKAKVCLEKALTITIQIGAKAEEASCCTDLGTVFQSLGEYYKAKEYLEKALVITIQIGATAEEARCYEKCGILFQSFGEYDKAKMYLEKALKITIKIGDRAAEASCYGNLAALYQALDEYVMAEDYVEKALSISQNTGDLEKEFQCLCLFAAVKSALGKNQEAFDCLILSIRKSESLRSFLGDIDDFKVSYSDVRDFVYRNLSALLCSSANPNHALYVLELTRARALADLMASLYSVESQISADPQSWTGIENIMKKESNSSCLYISYRDQELFLWVLKTSGIIHFRSITVDEELVGASFVCNLDHFFSKSFRKLCENVCENRIVNDVESFAALRLLEEEDEDEDDEYSKSSFSLYYRMLISPVADLLEEPELIVVPDRSLNHVPFAALTDEGGRYLSETFRIRIVPSLTTLKLIQDSPVDYHSQTSALIVGDPCVGKVRYKGKEMSFCRLPYAGKEALIIGRLLGVQPLLGRHATKQAVLERLHSASLIHFAAHGNAERGEIALSPVCRPDCTPEEEHYLLTMSDIAQVQLRAKLVVLSCCHSGHGQIRTEGVIGIARAFLGSGARSVLVSPWAIDDKATEQLMCCFYERLVRGESASESLYQAMEWMRANGFDKACYWAPFMLIGDNVTFDFEK